MSRSRFALLLVLPFVLLGLAACGDDETPTGSDGPTGPFDLTFTGDATFQQAHGGQEIHVAVEAGDGSLVASETGTVSAEQDPAFSFTFTGVLEEGGDYALKYWIDSNFTDESTAGVCDPKEADHQWLIDVSGVSDDVRVDDAHRPTETESVCDAFAFDLTFTGDASFQDAHGGQTLTAAAVRTGSGVPGGSMVVATMSTTVSSSADPSFSLDFPGVLALDQEYEIHYWIDSNFGDGTQGTCDEPDDDHQWRLSPFGPVTADVTRADSHRPTETDDVCSTFE